MQDNEHVATHLESIKRTTKGNKPVWRARALMELLGYESWEKFRDVVARAKLSCERSGMDADDHFLQAAEMVTIGSGAKRRVEDWFLSKHGCYLIAMGGDSSKPVIASAQAYFSVQTHRQEQLEQMTEEQRRLTLRNRLKNGNQELNRTAANAGVKKFGVFHDAGYKGMYGMGKRAVEAKKGLPENEGLLDCIGPTELAANEFRVTQTDDKIKREGIMGEQRAIDTHFSVAGKVRQTIKDIGGALPEHLPPQPSIKKLAAKHTAIIKQLKATHEKSE